MIELLIVLVIIGVVLYLVETYIPMDPAIKVVIRVIVILVRRLRVCRVCVWGPLAPRPSAAGAAESAHARGAGAGHDSTGPRWIPFATGRGHHHGLLSRGSAESP